VEVCQAEVAQTRHACDGGLRLGRHAALSEIQVARRGFCEEVRFASAHRPT
jgi:hypothetical protein